MGRPPLRKKGAFTDAERQRRRRKRLRSMRSAELRKAAARRTADQPNQGICSVPSQHYVLEAV
jgi:hypothetical protein